MTELAITYRGTVYPWHCDHMGHMNVTWYAAKFDEASWQALSNLGLTGAYLRDQKVGMVAVEQHTEYKRELLAGDTVTIRSTVNDIKDKTLQLVHEMINDQTGEIAAVTCIVGLHIDATTRRTLVLPGFVRDRALTLIGRENEDCAAGSEPVALMLKKDDSARLSTGSEDWARPMYT
jgi:acyl-CoA thioester hydrolase